MRRIISCFLISALLCALSLPAFAEEAGGLLDEEELTEIVESCLEGCNPREDNFGLAFCYTGTGETYYYQADNHFYSASLYKLPLCMRYAEKVAKGEMSWEDDYSTRTLDYLVRRTLVYSDNDTAGTLMYNDLDVLYGDNPYSLYADLSEEELAQMRDATDFSPRLVLNTLRTLYNNPERFPRIVDYMKEACPEDYFRGILRDRYEIAQKYGQMDGVLHAAGIIYTPTPILLVVMCDHMYGQLEAIERLAEAMADYSLTLDARQSEAEAEAHAQAEEAQRLEEEAKAEAERQSQAEAEARAQEQAAAEAAEKELAEQLEKEAARTVEKRTILFCSAAAVVLLGTAVILKKRR